MSMERIQKIMAQAGIASRRKCEDLIKKGLVKVNGKIITIGDKAGAKDRIEVNGKLIKKEKMIYILLNKPKNVLCSVGDKFERKTVIDIVRCKEKVFPVGRLDFNSEGLLILTNDGNFANRVIHPRYNIKKRYLVVLDKELDKTAIGKIKNGIKIEGRRVNVFDLIEEEKQVELGIHEGRKHIIKKIFDALGYKVVSLKRVSIGKLRLNLKAGEYKFTSKGWLERNIF